MAAIGQARHRSTFSGGSLDVVIRRVGAGVQIFEGGIYALNAAGFLVPAADVAGLTDPCTALQSADNTAGQDGDVEVLVNRNAASVEVQGAPRDGAKVFLVDNDVMNTTTTNSVPGGKIVRADAKVANHYVVAFREG